MTLFRPPSRGEVIFEVRAQLLRPVLLGTAILSGIYLSLGWIVPFFRSPRFPVDGLVILLLCAGCSWAMTRGAGGVQLAAALFLAGISQLFFYASQDYGVA